MSIAGGFCDAGKLSCAAHDMDAMLGSGYCGIEPGPVNDPPLLQRDDNAWELRTLRLMECNAVAQAHTVQKGLCDIHALTRVQFNHSVVISGSDRAS